MIFIIRTSKILLREVIIAISKYAFASTPFPLILSFETHCSAEQQNVMANILMEILGDMMVLVPFDENETRLPSPTDLLGKIIVKVLFYC